MWNIRYPLLPLEWIGMNAMLVYVMAAEGIFAGFINGWYYDDPHNTLVSIHTPPLSAFWIHLVYHLVLLAIVINVNYTSQFLCTKLVIS